MLNSKLPTPFYADDDGAGGAPPPEPPKTPKTFSEDYVQALREESKNHRLAHKATIGTLRSVLGLKDDEDPTEEKINAWKQAQKDTLDKALSAANQRLISAEIRGLADYDAKLVERLLDKSKVKVDENGNVTGLKEAIAELEKDFPAIKKAPAPPSGAPNPPPPGSKTIAQEINEVREQLKKTPGNRQLTERLFLLKEKAAKGG